MMLSSYMYIVVEIFSQSVTFSGSQLKTHGHVDYTYKY